MKMIKRTGPSTLPCGTPDVVMVKSESGTLGENALFSFREERRKPMPHHPSNVVILGNLGKQNGMSHFAECY